MSQPRVRRYLGMTILQLSILGLLVLALCCTLVSGIWILNGMVARAYTVPNLPGLNDTPLPTLTPAPTATPMPTATATPIPYESLIPPGWTKFTSTSDPALEVWLPPSYALQTTKNQEDAIPVYSVEEARSVLALMDGTHSPYLIFTTFEVVVRPAFAPTLDEMVDAEFGALMRSGRLLERDTFEFTVGDRPARKLVFDINVSGVNAGLALYAVQVGNEVWYLGFATPFNELYTRMPVFDQIIQTFRIVK